MDPQGPGAAARSAAKRPAKAARRAAKETLLPDQQGRFRRSMGLGAATAVNMTQMCGIGPFITIPLMVATMGGPQAIVGWVLGAVLAMADGLIWAELGAAMPGAGGSYLYLREAFQYRSGRLMPFLFVWTAVLTIPLIMSTGIIGIVQYLGYFFPRMGFWPQHLTGIGFTLVIVFALYRRIESIKVITTFLWIVMLIAVGMTIAASYSDFHPHLAFTYPGGFGRGFFGGLGAGLVIAIYDYLGYYTAAEMGDELANPGRVMPRSIVISITAMMVIYLVMNIGVVGTLPWQQVAKSSSIASAVVTRNWSHGAADVMTVLVLITASASVFAGLLGGSRLPYNAARDGVFFRVFARLHPRHDFPQVALLTMGLITAIGSFFNLTTVINILLAVTVLVQAVPQIVALTVLRRRQPSLHRPYRQWLYPLPSLIALAGWIYVYRSATTTALIGSVVWLIGGLFVYAMWARTNRAWPFGPLEVREVYLDEQRDASRAERQPV